jgi:hypothetical protein
MIGQKNNTGHNSLAPSRAPCSPFSEVANPMVIVSFYLYTVQNTGCRGVSKYMKIIMELIFGYLADHQRQLHSPAHLSEQGAA